MGSTVLARALLVALVVGCVAAGTAGAGAPDPFRQHQWGLERVRAPEAWDKGRGAGITIAVVDSGIDPTHEDLAGRVVAHVSCLGADGDSRRCRSGGADDHGHGTHVAGIAAATAGNGLGVAGVAPEARIMAVRVLERTTGPGGEESATGDVGDIRAGIRWAVDHGADVVNLSLAENVVLRNVFGSSLSDAIEYAWDRGVIPVLAAGNNAGNLFAAGYAGLPALVVTATNPENEQADYATNVGAAQWGLAAPGGEGGRDGERRRKILSTHWEEGERNEYAYMEGTSMATPHVAGAAAVLLSAGLSQEDVVQRLTSSAGDLGTPGKDGTYGWGLLDVAAAAKGLPDLPPPRDEPARRPAPKRDADVRIAVGPSQPAPPTTAALPEDGVYTFTPPPTEGARTEPAPARDTTRRRQGGGDGQALPSPPPQGGDGPGAGPVVAAVLGSLALLGVMARRAAVR